MHLMFHGTDLDILVIENFILYKNTEKKKKIIEEIRKINLKEIKYY